VGSRARLSVVNSGQVGTSPEAEEGGDDGGLSGWLDPPSTPDPAGSRYVWAPSGLFPAPYPPKASPLKARLPARMIDVPRVGMYEE
jgi:hypothetical protein